MEACARAAREDDALHAVIVTAWLSGDRGETETDPDGYACPVAGHRGIERLQTELDELFEDLWRGPWFTGQRAGFRPRVDAFVTEEPAELTIVVDLAGVDPADVSLVVAGHLLVVSGQRGLEPGSECTASWYQVEIPRGHFERRVRLPANANAAAARASYSRGLLTIVLPLAPRSTVSEPVPIPVQAG